MVDEYHAHPTSEIYDLGTNSFGKRIQSLLDVITTAGDDAGSKPCYVEETYVKRVLEDPTVIDDSYFVMIRELDEGDSPHNEEAWAKPNPCLRFPSQYSEILLKQIRDEHNAAYESNDPNKIRKFLTRRMCLWQVGSENRYLDETCMEKAKKAMVPKETFAALTDGLHCHCGFDLGKRIDLSGSAATFDLPDGRIAIKMHGFMPENGADRHEKTDRVPYKFWAQGGYCTLTPGDVTDNSYVYNWICEGERDHGWKVDEVDYDGHNATDLAIRMNEDRNREDFCVEVPQTCAGQNLAVKTFRELLLQDRVVIEENPLVLWCLQNAIEIQNNYGDIKLSKRHKDDTERIDPVAAGMNSLARVLVKRAPGSNINEHVQSEELEFVGWRMKRKKLDLLVKIIKTMALYFALYLDDLLLIGAGVCLVIAAYEQYGRPAGVAVAGVCLAAYAFIIARSRGRGAVNDFWNRPCEGRRTHGGEAP